MALRERATSPVEEIVEEGGEETSTSTTDVALETNETKSSDARNGPGVPRL